jgi:poly(glycerol-phosphate) alpha-glucosyltransferase
MFFSSRLPANIMAARGHSPSVVALEDDQRAEAVAAWSVDNLCLVPPQGPRGFLAVGRLLDAVRATRPDVVHLRGIWSPAAWAAYRWQKTSGGPLVISPHGMLDKKALRYSQLRKLVALALGERAGLRRANVIHALNESEARSIRAFGLDNPIATIANGVEIHAEVARRHDPDNKKRLLFLGRIHPKKGLAELIDAWAVFKRNSSQAAPWLLDIAGWDDGGHLAELERLAGAAGLGESIAFLGPLFGAAKRERMAMSDAFILPTFSEGMPIAVLEAWEAGLPVVTTDFANLPVGFRRRAALRTEPTPPAIAASLGELAAASDEQLREWGANGRRLVIDEFDWKRSVDRFEKLYCWLVRQAGRPDFVDPGPCGA